MKSHRGAAKRFKRTAGGRVIRHRAYIRHNLGKKSAKRKRALGRPAVVEGAEARRLKQMLPP